MLPPSTKGLTSGGVPSVKSKSGVVENVGIAVEILSLCRWKLLLHRQYKISDFSMGIPFGI